ncbi:wall-associated receptor kinase 2-like protein [Corchorus olitorius]|uniref:Wall-associated receptor kinase 2-like protein n=1 Tax=Corchorus olitorius TaxID=93759 RepID=A0A1R3FXV1_9ROSI|nr:wall-associated receptor kinase 2-like protein [Corchorus olitorius]
MASSQSGTLRELAYDFVKLDRFDGGNFRRWQKRMHFLLSTLNVVHVLTTPRLEESEPEPIAATRERQKWDNADYMCMGHILN